MAVAALRSSSWGFGRTPRLAEATVIWHVQEGRISGVRSLQKQRRPRYWVAPKTVNAERRSLTLKRWDEDGSRVLQLALVLATCTGPGT